MANKMALKALKNGGEDWRNFQQGNDLDFIEAEILDFNLNQRIFIKKPKFDRATFEWLDIKASEFKEGASFRNAKFNKRAEIVPQHSKESLVFSEAEFFDDVIINSADLDDVRIDLTRAKFYGRLFIQVGPGRGSLDFTSAEFYGDVVVAGRIGKVSFEGAKFGVKEPVRATFSGSELSKGANFRRAFFRGAAEFENTKFLASTFFEECVFCVAPNFHDAQLHQGTAFSPQNCFPKLFRDTRSNHASNAYRTLKLAMNAQHAHNEELGFFLLEMRSMAPRQKWWVRPFFHLYDLVSQYGISVWRPAALLVGFNIGVGLIFSGLTGRHWEWWAWDSEVLALTLYGAVPFAPALRSQVPEMSALFQPHMPAIVPVIVAVQGLLNAALLFLVLLGIRNTFRIR